MRATILICASAAATLVPAFAVAGTTKPTIQVSDAWLRATPKNAPVAGGYATIVNKGDQPDALLGASLPMAAKGEVHSMSMHNGIMRMKRLDKGLEIAAGATLTLAPGAYHLMFDRPRAQLKEGESVEGSLTFARAGRVDVTFAVTGMAAKAAPGARPLPGGAMTAMPGMSH